LSIQELVARVIANGELLLVERSIAKVSIDSMLDSRRSTRAISAITLRIAVEI
jgi:hypothetical protein